MNKYAIIANPGHNRIYFDAALKIALSELKAIAGAYGMEINEIGEGDVGLPASICFSSKRKLKEDFKALGFSSIYYALLEIVEDNLLRPINVPDFHTFSESMVQILKYNGKTNEQFTRLMVNLALSACGTGSDNITLLDPMCGKGTTLYEGFIRGFNVNGIEINEQWTQEIQLFTSDTRKANLIMKKKSCGIIVSDLPYGVQHGSKHDKVSIMSRGPIGLLEEAIPAWNHVLKTKGSIVLSYNEFTMKYEDVAAVLEKNEFKVIDESPYNNYLHRVNQSINRNLIVAVLSILAIYFINFAYQMAFLNFVDVIPTR